MSQTAITPKNTITAITGTTGASFAIAGRDAKGVLNWRQAQIADVPSSDNIMSHTASKTNSGWKSVTILKSPIMETISGATADGYVARPRVVDYLYLEIRVTRPDILSQAGATARFHEMISSSLDAKLSGSMLGYTPADS